MVRFGILFLLLCTTLTFAEGSTVYQWTNEQGVTSFSDKPHPDAKQVNIQQLPSQIPNQPVNQAGAPNSNVPPQPEQMMQTPSPVAPKQVVYKSLVITSPANEETVRDNSGNVNISISSDPVLSGNDKMAVYIDGQMMQGTGSSSQLNLTGLDRGTHTVQAKILDASGRVVATSKTNTFYLQKVGLNNPH